MKKNVLDALTERGFIEDTTHKEELTKWLEKPRKIYCGFDPTSDSLHLGNLVALIGLSWFQKYGHTPFAVMGGATGMIGDPSGKSVERNLLDEKALKVNIQGIQKNIEAILQKDESKSSTIIVNNYDWFKDFSLLSFLREIGKQFRLGPMLAKEGVKTRLQSEEGMSFTEFSYQLLQGYDFLYLFNCYDVSIQIGGSDQWGNITAGIDLIRKTKAASVYGITFPLLTRSDGKKFGKSEEGAIWLSKEKISSYAFYQYLYRIPDADVVRLLKMLTFLEMEEIQKIEQEMQKTDYIPNTAQKILAEEVTRLVHGEEGLKGAIEATKGARPGSNAILDASTLSLIAQEIPHTQVKKEEVLGKKFLDVAVFVGAKNSKSEMRRLIRGGGVYLNNQKLLEEEYTLSEKDLVDDHFLLIALGKKNKWLVEIVENKP